MEDSEGSMKLEFNKIQWDKIPWDKAYLTMPEFLKKFKLPQIVKVIVGFYGESGDSTVSANQILCLHCVKSIKKIRARDSNGKVFSLSLDCQQKVEVRPSKLKDIYDNVDELCKVFPRYVRVSQGYYDASRDEEILNVGDKLKLGSVERSKTGEKKLICINQNGNLLVLSQDCVAGFQPLFDGQEYYLAEVLKSFSLPLYVRFVKPNIMDKEIQRPLGTVCLEATYSERVITATTIRSDGQNALLEFASDVDVCLAVCEKKFRKSADYVTICQSLKAHVDGATEFEGKSSSGTIEREVLEAKVTTDSQKKKRDLPTQDSQHRPTIDDSEYSVPDEVFNFKNVRSREQETYSKCKLIEDSPYTQLDPTYVSTNSHEYGKLYGEYQSIPEISAIFDSNSRTTSGNNQPAKSNPPPHLRTSDMATRPLPQFPVSSPHLPTEPVRSPDHTPVVTPTRDEIYEAIAKYPKDLSNLTVTEVRKLMHNIGMGNYAEMFEAELVDGDMLSSMNAESLQSLNVSPFHITKLLKFIGGWRPNLLFHDVKTQAKNTGIFQYKV